MTDAHILVVDDEPLAAEQVARFLEGPSVRTSTAGSGRSTLALHTSDPADMIVTGQVLREAEAEALDAGATVLLRKPLDLNELAAAFNANLKAG